MSQDPARRLATSAGRWCLLAPRRVTNPPAGSQPAPQSPHQVSLYFANLSSIDLSLCLALKLKWVRESGGPISPPRCGAGRNRNWRGRPAVELIRERGNRWQSRRSSKLPAAGWPCGALTMTSPRTKLCGGVLSTGVPLSAPRNSFISR